MTTWNEKKKWAPDSTAVACKKCTTTFTFFNRKHHCRRCGEIFCDGCTIYWSVKVDGYVGASERVCEDCFSVSENVFSATDLLADSEIIFMGSGEEKAETSH